MPRKKRESHKKPSLQSPARVEVADKAVSSQILDTGPFGGDYPRLLLSLRDAASGDLFFVQINSPILRRRLPEQLLADGLQRPFAIADFAALPTGPPPDGVLREFLETLKPNLPEILFVDGLEHRIDANPKPGGALEEFNLGRERLANLGVVVVFLLPLYLIDLIRTYALNLWTWRAHHYVLDSVESTLRYDGMIQSLDTGHAIAPGDTSEARERRIRILRRLLDEGLAEHRTVESLTYSILIPLARELYDAGRYVEVLNVLNREKGAVEKAQNLQDIAAILGLAYTSLGQIDRAIEHYEQALAISREIGDRGGEESALGNLGNVYAHLGQIEKAVEHYEQALAISREIGDRRGKGNALGSLGSVYDRLGQIEKAVEHYEQALTIEREIGDRRGEGNILGNLGNASSDMGQNDNAIAYHEQALATAKEIGERWGEGNVLGNLGSVYARLGQIEKAVKHYEQALAIAREIGERWEEASILGNLGNVYARLGQIEKAEGYLKAALSIAREIKYQKIEGIVLQRLEKLRDGPGFNQS